MANYLDNDIKFVAGVGEARTDWHRPTWNR